MTRPGSSSFDRLRPRTPAAPAESPWPAPPATDGTGKRALFSVNEPAVPAFGSVSIDCSRCHQVSVLGMRQAVRLAVPSLYLPIVRGKYSSWLHCPACSSWAWTRVRIRV